MNSLHRNSLCLCFISEVYFCYGFKMFSARTKVKIKLYVSIYYIISCNIYLDIFLLLQSLTLKKHTLLGRFLSNANKSLNQLWVMKQTDELTLLSLIHFSYWSLSEVCNFCTSSIMKHNCKNNNWLCLCTQTDRFQLHLVPLMAQKIHTSSLN